MMSRMTVIYETECEVKVNRISSMPSLFAYGYGSVLQSGILLLPNAVSQIKRLS